MSARDAFSHLHDYGKAAPATLSYAHELRKRRGEAVAVPLVPDPARPVEEQGRSRGGHERKRRDREGHASHLGPPLDRRHLDRFAQPSLERRIGDSERAAHHGTGNSAAGADNFRVCPQLCALAQAAGVTPFERITTAPRKSPDMLYTIENMMNQEFQHCAESQLIEVMNMKMHVIQFGLIVNAIRMKLNEIFCSPWKSLHIPARSILKPTPV
jgi:hypothetical protein